MIGWFGWLACISLLVLTAGLLANRAVASTVEDKPTHWLAFRAAWTWPTPTSTSDGQSTFQTAFASFRDIAVANNYLPARAVTEASSAQLRAGCVQNARRLAQMTPSRGSPQEACKKTIARQGQFEWSMAWPAPWLIDQFCWLGWGCLLSRQGPANNIDGQTDAMAGCHWQNFTPAGRSRRLRDFPVAEVNFSDRVRLILWHRGWEPLIANARGGGGAFCKVLRGLLPECAAVCAQDHIERLAGEAKRQCRKTRAMSFVYGVVGGLVG